MRELERRHNVPNDLLDIQGGHLPILGEKSTCSSCHAAMAEFADRHDMTIEYHWNGDPSAHRVRDRSPGAEYYP